MTSEITKKNQAGKAWDTFSPELAHLLCDSSPAFVLHVSAPDKRIRYANSSFCRAIGQEPEALIDKHLGEVLCPENMATLATPLDELEASGVMVEKPIDFIAGVRKVRLRANFIPEKDDNGRVIGLLLLAHDFSHLLRTETALKTSRDRYKTYVTHAPDAIFVLDEEGRVVDVNPAGCRIVGYELDKFIGLSYLQVIVPADRNQAAESYAILRERGNVEAELRVETKQGELIWLEIRAVMLSENRFLAFCKDITRRKDVEEKLQQREARYHALAEATFEAVFISEYGICIETNRAACQMFDYTYDELIGIFGTDVIAPEFKDLVRSNMLSGYEEPYEVVCMRRDGSTFPAEICGKPSRYQGRSVRITVMRDISDRKAAQRELQTSEDIVNSVPSGILIYQYHPPDKLILVKGNPEAERLTGIDIKECLGTELEEIWPNAGKLGMLAKALEVIRTGEPYEAEEAYYEDYRISGTYRLKAFAMPGDRLGLGFESTTELKKAEEALRMSEAVLSQAQEIAGIGSFVWNLQTDALDYSANLLALSGRESLPPDLTGRQAVALMVHPKDRNKVSLNFRNMLKSKTTWPLEYRVVTPDGEIKWWRTRVKIVYDDNDRPEKAIGVHHDITERVKTERDKQEIEQQLRQAQKMEAIGSLAGGVAHDFNNILAAITGFTELAIESSGEGLDCRSDLEKVIKSAERAKNLVRQILTFSRKMESKLQSVDLNGEIMQASEMLTHTLPRMISLEHYLAPDLIKISADKNQISQVLINLASNAADAMPDGGRLVFRTKNTVLDEDYCRLHTEMKPGRYVLLEISDTGCGMDDKVRQRIFDPFYTTKEVNKGTGLGLSTVFGIVKSHHGHIFCYSEPSQGTTFRIYFPFPEEARVPADELAETGEAPEGGSETVLLVDDEPALLAMAEKMLGKAGYRVRKAASGEEALSVYGEARGEIDLIILDLSMPGMGGHQCLDKLLETDPGAKVLIASGYSVHGNAWDTIEAGAMGYLHKPFKKTELLKAVRRSLDYRN